MILLNPIWLFALAALSIPVVIHLWNIRQGRTLKVGSIALINSSAQKSSRSFKLHDLLLLLIRCLLLALLALVLAAPFWQKQISLSGIKGWILISKDDIKESYQQFKPRIDSLTKAGYEFHYFNKGFARAELDKVLVEGKPVADSTNKASDWSLIQQLDGQLPSSLPIYLFTPNSIRSFKGPKPAISLNVHWQTYIPADSVSTWIEKAWLTNNNDIQVVQGNSKPGGTVYTNYIIRSGNERNTPFVVNTANGRLTVGLKNANTIAVDTVTWRFAIYAEKNTPDAGYIKAALASIIRFSNHKAVIKEYSGSAQIDPHQQWVFWLNSKPVSKQVVQSCNNLFIEEAGKSRETSSWISEQTAPLSQQKISLYKTIDIIQNKGQVIWSDGFGNPVLNLETQPKTNIYHFFSRFDPAWSSLVWNDNFPKMLLRLMVNPIATQGTKYDRRAIADQQLLPAMNNKDHAVSNKVIELTALTRHFWLLLLLTFILERWLAHKKTNKTVLQNG